MSSSMPTGPHSQVQQIESETFTDKQPIETKGDLQGHTVTVSSPDKQISDKVSSGWSRVRDFFKSIGEWFSSLPSRIMNILSGRKATALKNPEVGTTEKRASDIGLTKLLSNPLSSKSEDSQFKDLQSNFWIDHIVNDKIHLPFQITVINSKNNANEKARSCAEQYVQLKRLDDPNFLKDLNLEKNFIDTLMKEIELNLLQPPEASSTLNDDKIVKPKTKLDTQPQVLPDKMMKMEGLVCSIRVSEAGDEDYDESSRKPEPILDGDGNPVRNADGDIVYQDLPANAQMSLEYLKVYRTYGEGSCGLHAMLGVPDNSRNLIKLPNPQDERNALCAGIKNAPEDSKIRKLLTPILEEYYSHPDTAPKGFKSQLSEVYREYQRPPGKSKEDFAKDPRVLDAYLNNLKNVNQFLLLEEIHIAALVFNKRVVIYQKLEDPSIQTEDPLVGYRVFNPGGEGTPVKMWYNGYMHYERVDVQKFDEQPTEKENVANDSVVKHEPKSSKVSSSSSNASTLSKDHMLSKNDVLDSVKKCGNDVKILNMSKLDLTKEELKEILLYCPNLETIQVKSLQTLHDLVNDAESLVGLNQGRNKKIQDIYNEVFIEALKSSRFSSQDFPIILNELMTNRNLGEQIREINYPINYLSSSEGQLTISEEQLKAIFSNCQQLTKINLEGCMAVLNCMDSIPRTVKEVNLKGLILNDALINQLPESLTHLSMDVNKLMKPPELLVEEKSNINWRTRRKMINEVVEGPIRLLLSPSTFEKFPSLETLEINDGAGFVPENLPKSLKTLVYYSSQSNIEKNGEMISIRALLLAALPEGIEQVTMSGRFYDQLDLSQLPKSLKKLEAEIYLQKDSPCIIQGDPTSGPSQLTSIRMKTVDGYRALNGSDVQVLPSTVQTLTIANGHQPSLGELQPLPKDLEELILLDLDFKNLKNSKPFEELPPNLKMISLPTPSPYIFEGEDFLDTDMSKLFPTRGEELTITMQMPRDDHPYKMKIVDWCKKNNVTLV